MSWIQKTLSIFNWKSKEQKEENLAATNLKQKENS